MRFLQPAESSSTSVPAVIAEGPERAKSLVVGERECRCPVARLGAGPPPCASCGRGERSRWSHGWPVAVRGRPRGTSSPDEGGRPLVGETVTHAFQAALAAGLPKFRFHDLRHSAATFPIPAGIPLKHVSDLLGHSTIVITADIYGHLLDESNAAAGEAIAQTLFGVR